MNKLTLISLTGLTPYKLYVCDERLDNESYLGDITIPTPPNQVFMPPSLFDNSPKIMVIIEDVNFNRYYKLLYCRYNCNFEIKLDENSP